ncbi:unnamed protein product [Brugia pahangi]|uniref:Uncharacterized protein n=1 Tax=Brugia pahangi TaxID=6280 RepID=A0A0N4SXF5_BRUPA|nr:unnamed protein product [Brugia pahangi]
MHATSNRFMTAINSNLKVVFNKINLINGCLIMQPRKCKIFYFPFSLRYSLSADEGTNVIIVSAKSYSAAMSVTRCSTKFSKSNSIAEVVSRRVFTFEIMFGKNLAGEISHTWRSCRSGSSTEGSSDPRRPFPIAPKILVNFVTDFGITITCTTIIIIIITITAEGKRRSTRVATQHKTQTLLKWEKQDIPNGTLSATK